MSHSLASFVIILQNKDLITYSCSGTWTLLHVADISKKLKTKIKEGLNVKFRVVDGKVENMESD